jgi:hypothetical protein
MISRRTGILILVSLFLLALAVGAGVKHLRISPSPCRLCKFACVNRPIFFPLVPRSGLEPETN